MYGRVRTIPALQVWNILMKTQDQKPPSKGNTPQGDNRKAGDVDGNRGAKPKSGTQGPNESAGNQADGPEAGQKETPDAGTGEHSEAEALYRDRE
jgi:hypothetical protein